MIEINNAIKKYYVGMPNELTILKNINLNIKEGEFVSIVGASGSGKSTLMNIIGALDRPTSGTYTLDGISIEDMSQNELSEIRNKKIGFVFQTFNLIPRSTALSNVELPLFYLGIHKEERRKKAVELLELVGMGDRMTHMPNELSGGQKQRVAIARALANDPAIILADEPTGALDTQTGKMVMDIFLKIHREEHKTIILITHNPELAEEAERQITLSDGMITGDFYNSDISRLKCEAMGVKA
ncbi:MULTISPECIES: ABC transporter ATP-binding protein [unclassified Dehalobacter]|jgi:ABC-type antimicrobial peptide transport system, ATPase component|uniref:ABC transporter ATP-binding protein n=1 Tax=unclassified Dehalobacter TaxID=2635733 RepID=UPI00028A5BEC|nr:MULTISPECIES: ABC transporter ATP-binding protein [unclassified Dehalobacter]AFV03692.1 ABC-type antimicrobial peptide transport system, ATPase component [Dehalobacter sp. DCA]AFV06679.1 ABC-type antimicrobial peptide transport system, ATPase component [Dehalobacter sp. CF]